MLVVAALAGCHLYQAPPRGPPYPKTAIELPAVPFHLMGLALADINGDGFDDIVVAGGFEGTRGHLLVYSNDGHGGFPAAPWQSDASDYFGFVAIADLDRDGHLDVAVGVRHALNNLDSEIEVFRNLGTALEKTPSGHTSTEAFYPFRIAFGDEDGDAQPDLAVSVVQVGEDQTQPARIYRSRDGGLEAVASWTANVTSREAGRSVKFVDANDDGWLDLEVGAWDPLIYLGHQGSITSSRPWTFNTTDPGVAYSLDSWGAGDARSAVEARNDCDANEPGTPIGLLVAYALKPQMTPIWRGGRPASAPGCYGADALAELDGDGLPDLVAGGWSVERLQGGKNAWGGKQLQIFKGLKDGTFADEPWESETAMMAESIAFSDLDNSATRRRVATFAPTRMEGYVTLEGTTVQRVEAVSREGRALDRTEYLWVPGGHWVSFARPLTPREAVTVTYWSSDEPDIVVSSFGVEARPSGSVLIFPRLKR